MEKRRKYKKVKNMSKKIEIKENENVEEVTKFFIELESQSVLIDWKKLTPEGKEMTVNVKSVALSKDENWTIINVENINDGDTILLPNYDDEKVPEGERFWRAFGKSEGLTGHLIISDLVDLINAGSTTFKIVHMEKGRVFNF